MERHSDVEADEAFALLRGNGQPWQFVLQAVQIAASPKMARDLIHYTGSGEATPHPVPPRPPIRDWMAMYHGHRSMQNSLASCFGWPEEFTTSEGMNELRSISRMSRNEIATLVSELTQKELEDFLRPFIGVPFPPDDVSLHAMLADLDADATPDGPDVQALMSSPAGQFFFRVWWPSLILYREYPPKLLRAARLGNLDALDRLLRLDKHVIGDPVVARILAEVLSSGVTNDKKRITNALHGRPTVRLTDANIRAALAGLISQLAYLFHTKVTAPEIQALFDGIARVRSGRLTDTAIPATPESWSKAVQRQRNWPSLPDRPPGQ